MSTRGKMIGRIVRPVTEKKVPGLAAGFVREAFVRAVDGFGPLKGAAESADKKLADNNGDVSRAIHDIIELHVRLAGAQGFVTNIGGLVTMALTIPANISGLALLQCHLVGGIAHLRGYDLADPRVRNAVLACMLGEDAVKSLVKRKRLPTSPMGIATAPVHDVALDRKIATEVTAELIGRVAGKKTMSTLGRRMPIIGGGFGAVTDGYGTYQVGRYADRELKTRK